jgi:DNA-binding MarR family transcriptional regulator
MPRRAPTSRPPAPADDELPDYLASERGAGPEPPPTGFLGRVFVTGMLSRLARDVAVVLDRSLAPLGISFSQYLVLVRLWRAHPRPLSQAFLVRDLALERSSLSTLLASLERSGLVVRTQDGADRRRRRVALTPAGSALETSVLEVLDEIEGALVSALDDRKRFRDELAGLLDRADTLRRGPLAP